MNEADKPADQRLLVAQRLREAREYLGLSQEEVATAMNLSRPAITNIESGVRKVEALELDRFAQLYGRDVNHFLGKDEANPIGREGVAFYARNLKGLSQKDLDEVARFADFLRVSSKRPKGTGGRGR